MGGLNAINLAVYGSVEGRGGDCRFAVAGTVARKVRYVLGTKVEAPLCCNSALGPFSFFSPFSLSSGSARFFSLPSAWRVQETETE